MTVSNGQSADQNSFNNAFVSKQADSEMEGELSLNNVATGAQIVNTQDVLLDLLNTLGFAEGDTDQKTYANTNYIANADDYKTCIEKLDARAAVDAGDLTTHMSDTSTHGVTTVAGISEVQTLTNKTIDGDNNTISNLAHGSEVDNPSSGVHGVTGSVVGTSDAQTLTTKTIDGNSNTLTVLAASQLSGATPIGNGGTGQTTQQAAIDALTAVSGATTGHVLTKDGSGNATFQASSGGSSILPSGSLVPFAGSSTPSGFLACDGSAVSRATYSDLFTAISTTWGVGDGSTTFNVPDLRGSFLRGVGTHGTATMANGSPYAGPSLGASENDQMQGHYHNTNIYQGAGLNGYGPVDVIGGATMVPAVAASTDSTNGTPRTGDETRPFAYGCNYIIKT